MARWCTLLNPREPQSGFSCRSKCHYMRLPLLAKNKHRCPLGRRCRATLSRVSNPYYNPTGCCCLLESDPFSFRTLVVGYNVFT
uniref:Uncharacterized protein n=1 Tax=Anguilla anguilla TaxID=7936 RepID=A0A0E9TAV8_ANGAN